MSGQSHELIVHLDAPLPPSLEVGAGTALFVGGTCFCPTERIRSIELVVNGRAVAPMAEGMPRLDYFRAQHPGLDPFGTTGLDHDLDSPADPRFHSYRSGFWGIAPVAPVAPGSRCELSLRAHLHGGGVADVLLADIPTTARAKPAELEEPEPAAGRFVAICMATYDPSPEMLRHQIDTIRAQTHRNWVCVISDDCSKPELFAAIEDAVRGDSRFGLSRSPRRLGFYRNFERALALAPVEAHCVAMADQDDSWHPDKLETLLTALGDAQLVYSDARIVKPGGEVVSDTYWTHRRNNHSSMASLLVANCVTGAASLCRRDLLDHALPFPPAQFAHFHDHWVALTALARGDIAFVNQPLYDYVQHGEAVIGHAAANGLITAAPQLSRLERLRQDPRERVARWRFTYFVANCRLAQYAAVLQMRCGGQMARAKRRTIKRFLRADRSVSGLAWLWLRARREASGRPETLGGELGLLAGFLWRRALGATAGRSSRPRRRLRLDALPPRDLAPGPRLRGPAGPQARALAEAMAPLSLTPVDGLAPRINVLVAPEALGDPPGERVAELQLARRLAESGHRVRVVTVEPVGALGPPDRPASLPEQVELVFGREAGGIELSRSDHFVATTWQSAHIAHAGAQSLGGSKVVYLIREHEPLALPSGSAAALAAASYAFPHFALFSSELLRDYFRRHTLGVFGRGIAPGDDASAAFEHAIPKPVPASANEPTLVFHARPEPDGARHMFELGLMAINRALESGALAGWALSAIGTTARGGRLPLGGGSSMKLLSRGADGSYAGALGPQAVGLALMRSAHPGLTALEMAAAGAVTVTNSFENKTARELTEISPNLVAAEPTVESIAARLRDATAIASGSRPDTAKLNWSREWDDSFDDPLLDRLTAFLAG